MSKNVLIITGDPIGAKLAGPAIRAWNMATELSSSNQVRLLSLTGVDEVEADFEITHVPAFDDSAFLPHHEWADVIVFQGHAMLVFNQLRDTQKIVVVDIYDPMHLEQLEQARELPQDKWIEQVRDATTVLNEQLLRGDFFLCASERQKMFWLGQLAALGRVNPLNYAHDPDLNRLIGISPFGLSRTEPQHVRNVLKGVYPGIRENDKVILWSGGLYNWFDPQTLIKAVASLAKKRPEVKLFFQGTKHPHPGVPEMEIVGQSRELARNLGVLDSNVFFNDSWVDFDDRQNYLTEADLGVSTHHSHVETTFSFRTRILDYLWANLPMVVTEGDHFGDLVREKSLGVAVSAGNVEELEKALETMLFDEKFVNRAKKNIKEVRKEYFWDVVLRPLTSFVETASHAADRGLLLVGGNIQGEALNKINRKPKFMTDVRLAFSHFKSGGISAVLGKAKKRLRRR